MTLRSLGQTILIVLLAAVPPSGALYAEEVNTPKNETRWDVSLELPVWPSLGELQPAGGGSFDSLGFGLGISVHWPVKQFAGSELLLGLDGSVAATPSNIRGNFDTLLARQLYMGGSAKWLFGARRNVSLDAGIGYHEVDMAQVDSEWYGTLEYEHWSTSKPGGFVGATWDIGAGRPDHNSGLFIGLRIHFADFGRAYDKEFVPGRTTLGPNAGEVSGPLYVLRIGYSGR